MRRINARGTYQERLLRRCVVSVGRAWRSFDYELNRPALRELDIVVSKLIRSNQVFLFEKGFSVL